MYPRPSFVVQNRLENIASLKKNSNPSSKLQLCHLSVSVTYVITRGQCHHRLQRRQREMLFIKDEKELETSLQSLPVLQHQV